ncbi:MAG TPA: hypothetical protein VFG06_07350 [Thermodesulfovibrionales bacterium]|nr:hypothetical protein [Thermodesulfovibrionales bacterium]
MGRRRPKPVTRSITRRETVVRNITAIQFMPNSSSVLASVPVPPWPKKRLKKKTAQKNTPVTTRNLRETWRLRNGTELKRQKT